jgi:hypothetical protein
MEYSEKVRSMIRKLKGGREWFILQPGESATIVVISDVDDFVEVPTHRYEGETLLCGTFQGSECQLCDAGLQTIYRVALHVSPEDTGEDLVAVWAWGQDSPLKVMSDVFSARGVPFRGMRLAVRRLPRESKGFWDVTYLGNIPVDKPPLPRAEVVRRAAAQVLSWSRKNRSNSSSEEDVPF